jgi:hypothetical protein
MTQSALPLGDMIITIDGGGPEKVEGSIRLEPYTASGQVFDSVLIQPWSQVIPEITPGTLREEIGKEQARFGAQSSA